MLRIQSVNNILKRMAQVLARVMPAHGAMSQTAAVYALTDEELERRGLKRRDAAHQLMINGDWR